ncbi:PA0069 family radical SAM protein [Shimia sp. R11_0]|uniref:PA0069 family radical SAM protein n=1 Tax=Shimia sp. R11_0 TaxID=2821096 RepID=UPI001ADBE74F|nr:PA0069 family radical SAM protein [Shimia sp. R11_0]MBO9476909.1 PA0069 family radical SAM protein [Shimia sp. R11_0]
MVDEKRHELAAYLERIDPRRRRARGARSNASGRFETSREEVWDGWDMVEERAGFATEVREEAPRSVIVRNQSPDVPFDQSLNPYRGCEHGCIYCFARPTHAYLGLSPGLDFESKLVARPNAAQVLERQLRSKSYVPDVLALGTNTDPYQPIERRYRIMRGILEVLERFQHPVAIVTKGTLIERDIDILQRLAQRGLAQVGVSLTTLDEDLSRAMEPRVPLPARRVEMIRRLSAADIPVRVMLAPVVPGLSDHEVERLLAAGAQAGARAASWIMLRLPGEVAPLFEEWLEDAYPARAGKVMARLREMHGGDLYQAAWGKRMRGEGIFAEMIAQRFEAARKRLGLLKTLPELRRDLFEVPIDQDGQMALF